MDMMDIFLLVMFIGGCITAVMCIIGLVILFYQLITGWFNKD